VPLDELHELEVIELFDMDEVEVEVDMMYEELDEMVD
tara:strand:- start:184 stop:294 length:111 start_codon:yes stop_codon:yes gene_type:complete